MFQRSPPGSTLREDCSRPASLAVSLSCARLSRWRSTTGDWTEEQRAARSRGSRLQGAERSRERSSRLPGTVDGRPVGDAMIELTGLTKRYGSFTAVDALDLHVPKGELFGFLGPNGAGKTTTLRMIAGILRPTAGSVRISGLDVATDPIAAKSILGYIPDRPFIYEKLTGMEFLRFVAGLYDQDGPEVEHRARE